MKKVAIMQPYFLPYIGYFQLIAAVDEFVIYDNIQFSKKGWIHRNRMLQNGKDEYFSLTLKKDSDYLDVNHRFLSEGWPDEREKTLRKIKENYRKAPHFEQIFPKIEEIFRNEQTNLFNFIFSSLKKICNLLDINTPLVISSEIDCDHTLKSQDRVMAICSALGATDYLNPIGGWELYNTADFVQKNINLHFQKIKKIEYQQMPGREFVPWLSILDVLMFNDLPTIKNWLGEFDYLRKES